MVDFGTSDSTVQISCCNFNYIKRALNGIVRLKMRTVNSRNQSEVQLVIHKTCTPISSFYTLITSISAHLLTLYDGM